MTSQLMAPPELAAAPQPPPRPSSRWRVEPAIVLVVAILTGIASVVEQPSPTGRPLVDAVVVGGAAAVVSLAGAMAPRWSLVILGTTAIAIAGTLAIAAGGVVAFGLALFTGRQRPHRAVLGAMSAAVAVSVLVRADLDAAFGVTSAISLAACTLVFFAGIRNCSRRARRVAYASIAVGLALAVVSSVAFGVAGYKSRHDLAEGVRAAERAVSALEYGDYETAEREFDVAAAALERAHAALASPLVAGAGVVPILAQHHDAAFDMSAVGASGAAAVADALDDIDPDTLHFERGRIDVAAISALSSPLHRVETALEELHATVDESTSPWLIGRAAVEMRDFQTSVAEHLPQLENALGFVELAPRLLGADRPHVYLVLFTTPSEARALGGFTGNYAELSIADGQLALGNLGRASEFDAAAQAAGIRISGPQNFLDRYGRFGYEGAVGRATLRNLTMTPNFPWVGAIARDVYAQTTGRNVDGVIAVDPYVIAALLEYAGPIELTTFPEQLHAGNAAQFLLRDQYVLGAADNEQRIDALAEAAERTMSAVLEGSLPDPTTIAGDLAPLANERRLMLWSADPIVQQLIEQIGIDGAVPELHGREGWSVTLSNAGGSKIDTFLSPSISYSSSVEAATGRTNAEIRVRLSNTAPASGLPRYVIGNDVGLPLGTSRLYVSAYSSLELAAATLDGAPVIVERGLESGWNVYSQFVDIPPGGAVTLVFELDGIVARPGEVVTWQQPLAFDSAPVDG